MSGDQGSFVDMDLRLPRKLGRVPEEDARLWPGHPGGDAPRGSVGIKEGAGRPAQIIAVGTLR